MQIINTVKEMIKLSDDLKRKGKTLGFIPTMGALHEGHASLFHKSREQMQVTCVSVFVNPTQFNDPNDFAKYPNTLEHDRQLCLNHGVDIFFSPSKSDIYPDDYNYSISERSFSLQLCGAHRPGHFDGVLTVVMKLLQIVNPDQAFFGEKDYQQLMLIRGLAEAFFLRCQIVSAPTVREKDGLAMSSRNSRLSSEQRLLAPEIYRSLKEEKTLAAVESRLQKKGFKVEYAEEKEGRRFIAAFLGEVRLIDNVKI
jgi:pantoate--beta-alanine ligase